MLWSIDLGLDLGHIAGGTQHHQAQGLCSIKYFPSFLSESRQCDVSCWPGTSYADRARGSAAGSPQVYLQVAWPSVMGNGSKLQLRAQQL